jgi:hypothetical protein
MPNPGNNFKDSLIQVILNWNLKELKVYSEVYVGSRFVGKKRKLDIVLSANNKTLGIEAKTQQTGGTAYQKLAYAIEDSKRCPIPTLIVFSGEFIEQDVKAQLVSSGIGIEMEWTPEKGFGFGLDILKQRVMIELGMDWLLEQEDRRILKDNKLF